MKITRDEKILYTYIVASLEKLYDRIADEKLERISPGMMLSAMAVGVIARREGDGALNKMVEALQHLVELGEG